MRQNAFCKESISARGHSLFFTLFLTSGKAFFYTLEVYLFYTRLSFQLYFHIYVVTAGLKMVVWASWYKWFFFLWSFLKLPVAKNTKQKNTLTREPVGAVISTTAFSIWIPKDVSPFIQNLFQIMLLIEMKGERYSGDREQNPVARNSPRKESGDPQWLRTFAHIKSGGFLLSR